MKESPGSRLLLGGGDWNPPAPGEMLGHSHKLDVEEFRPPPLAVTELDVLWRPLRDQLVEFETKDPSHFDKPNMLVGRWDWRYFMMPPWQAWQLDFTGGATSLPELIFAYGLGDPLPIALWEAACKARSMGSGSLHKEKIREAAGCAMASPLQHEPHGVLLKAQTLASLSCTLGRSDVALAWRMIQCNDTARRHIIFDHMVGGHESSFLIGIFSHFTSRGNLQPFHIVSLYSHFTSLGNGTLHKGEVHGNARVLAGLYNHATLFGHGNLHKGEVHDNV